MKDLRDSFASQLLTAGVQLAYVSTQLGHADVAVTAKHYARWCGGAKYRRPLVPEAHELPADLLARIAPSYHDFSTSSQDSGVDDLAVGAEERSNSNSIVGSGGWTRTNDLRLMKPSL